MNDERSGWRGSNGSQPHRRPESSLPRRHSYYVMFEERSTRSQGSCFLTLVARGIQGSPGTDSTPRIEQPDLTSRQIWPPKTDCDVRRQAAGRGPDNCPYRWPCLPRADNRGAAVMDRAGRKRSSGSTLPGSGWGRFTFQKLPGSHGSAISVRSTRPVQLRRARPVDRASFGDVVRDRDARHAANRRFTRGGHRTRTVRRRCRGCHRH